MALSYPCVGVDNRWNTGTLLTIMELITTLVSVVAQICCHKNIAAINIYSELQGYNLSVALLK